jgi:Nucleotide modification associated domain 3
MKAMLLRVGIDKGSDGILSPILPDGNFEYIPLSESEKSGEKRTYHNLIGRTGKPLSHYLPSKIASRQVHYDPEFLTCSYVDRGTKAKYLLKLKHGDLLVFYAGLKPYNNNIYVEGLYIIGYFTVKEVLEFSSVSYETMRTIRNHYPHNSHLKRNSGWQEMVLVLGDPPKCKLLKKAILISNKRLNRIGRAYNAVSPTMENLLGIKGSIQRSIPPRFIVDKNYILNLKKMVGLKK